MFIAASHVHEARSFVILCVKVGAVKPSSQYDTDLGVTSGVSASSVTVLRMTVNNCVPSVCTT